jgi:formylglycine-generating enzyme required for sulfatase activity
VFLAEQISVRREVILEQLDPEVVPDPEAVESFLADVRAMAGLHHPGIGSVYEAVRDGGTVFFTRELLPGRSMEELLRSGERFPPQQILQMLRQIGEAMAYLEEEGIATRRIEPGDLVFGAQHVFRMANLAVAEPGREDGDPEADRKLVAGTLLEALELGLPGATRATSLLNQLGADGPDTPGWEEVAGAADKLLGELDRRRLAVSQPLGVPTPPRRGPGVLVAAVSIVLGALAVVGAGIFLATRDQPASARPLRAMVEIPPVDLNGQDGIPHRVARFWIDTEEVTISEYAAFLEALEVIDPASRDAYDHPDQPQAKNGHLPGDWDAILAAAKSGEPWNSLPVDFNCPVVNVDWWDAYAYANWRGGRLPAGIEWAAAAMEAPGHDSGWGPVDASPGDCTPAGVRGLGGNVSEWVADSARNPAFPMNPKSPMACGSSHLRPGNGSKARRWLPSRDVRQPDLGFRIVRESAPEAAD